MNVDFDDSGFLLDPEDWDEELAVKLATDENIQLNEEHWNIIQHTFFQVKYISHSFI